MWNDNTSNSVFAIKLSNSDWHRLPTFQWCNCLWSPHWHRYKQRFMEVSDTISCRLVGILRFCDLIQLQDFADRYAYRFKIESYRNIFDQLLWKLMVHVLDPAVQLVQPAVASDHLHIYTFLRWVQEVLPVIYWIQIPGGMILCWMSTAPCCISYSIFRNFTRCGRIGITSVFLTIFYLLNFRTFLYQ